MRAIARLSENSLRSYSDAMNNSAPAIVHPFQKHFDALQVPDGGFSINPLSGKSPSKQYMVAEPGHEQEFNVKDMTPDHIANHAKATQSMYDDLNMFQGGWNDPSSGKAYLDVSRQYGDYGTAQDAARRNKQLAIFDTHAGKSIPTEYLPGDEQHA